MTPGYLLGIDVGTTFCKAGMVAEDGREVAHGRAPTPWRTAPTGGELDPNAVIEAVRTAVGLARTVASDGQVLAVGVTGMAETGALLDRSGRPVAPAVAWFDTRAERQAAELVERFGPSGFAERTGLAPARLLSACVHRWLRHHHPGAEAGRRWLSLPEWVVRALGGDEVAELSLASRTGFLDLAARRWWQEVVEWSEAPAGFLPEPQPAGTPAGRVAGGASLPGVTGAVLAVGGHDHPCAAVGAGAVGAEDVFDSCGTAEALVRSVDPNLSADAIRRCVSGGVTVGWHVIPGRMALLAGFKSGRALERVLTLLGLGHGDLDRLDAEALALRARPASIVVEGITEDTATVSGIGWDAGPAAVWRAALDALAEHARARLDLIEATAGPLGRLVVTGGWARRAGVRAAKHRVLGPFEEPPVAEAGARGAALLAGIAAGVYGGIDDLPEVT